VRLTRAQCLFQYNSDDLWKQGAAMHIVQVR